MQYPINMQLKLCVHSRKFFGTLLLILFSSLHSLATNYYVNNGSTSGDVYCSAVGNDGNAGTSANAPKATFTAIWTAYGPSGTNVLALGDTVFVDAGTYFQTDRNLVLNVPIVINGAGMQKTTFDNGQDGVTGYYFARLAAGVHLMNFKISQYGIQNTYAHAVEIEAGVIGAALKYIHIDDCGRDSGMYPIEVRSGASVLFQGGGLTCNDWLQSGGIHIVGAATVVNIIDYVFYKNSRGFDDGAAIRMENGTTTVRNALFEENRCNNGGVSSVFQGAGTLRIYDSKFLNNEYLYSFNEYGGNILVNGGSFLMKRSIVQGTNRVGGSFAYGAGICFDGTTALNTISAQIDSCRFVGNIGDRGNDIHAQRSNTTVNVFNTTLGSSSAQVGTRNSAVINLTNCGNPGEYAGGGTVNRINTLNATYVPNPTVADYSGTCGALTILPVELVGFVGVCNGDESYFVWATASETNNDYFIVSSSLDGETWLEYEQVNGQGTTQGATQYSVSASDARTGYYKLSQVDFNGQVQAYSAIYFESCALNDGILGSYYNSNDNSLQITYHFEQNAQCTVQLVDQMGRSVFNEVINFSMDQSTLQITDLKNVVSGIYFLNIQGEFVQESSRVCIVR